jgi:two-component system response regulator FixJ
MRRTAKKTSKHIFFVDDEPDVRLVVRQTLQRLDSQVTCFPSGADCLERLRRERCDLLITDVKMPDMDGLELLVEAKRLIPSLQVLVITGYGDISTAVRALKAGASDFIEKPLETHSFRSTVASLLDQATGSGRPARQVLTRTEAKVLRLILDGKNNAEIARRMSRSPRTIEDHRAHIMHKLGVDNLVDLVKQVAVVRLPSLGRDE